MTDEDDDIAHAPTAPVVHIQIDASRVFCGASGPMPALKADAWAADPSTIQKATCPDCLLRVFMLGDSAKIKLAHMGMRVDVHDVEDEALSEN